MKAILFVICGFFLANIVTATFIWPPKTKASDTLAPVVNAATRQGQYPWMVNERYNAPNRDRTRKATLDSLDKPWAGYCTSEGHEALIRAINYYYDRRGAEAWSYGHTYGEDARRFAIKAWISPDDSRIERLMGETYGRGYFSLDELKSSARETLAAQLSGVHVSAKPCAS
jgi:hypothetical protein